jgi:ataxin-3
MVISQAEAEGKFQKEIAFVSLILKLMTGYSVFAVTQADPHKPLALFRTQVDMIFSIIAEPTSSSAIGLENTLATLKGGSKQPGAVHQSTYDEEDDYELQQALQASLQGPTHSYIGAHADVSISPDPSTPTGEVDPIAASMERNRLLLQHMREQQEFAQRELWSESDFSPEEQAALDDRRATLQRQEEEEERELRRAIEESEALAWEHAERMGHSTERARPQPQPVQTPLMPSLTDLDSESDDDQTSGSIVTHEEPVQAELTVEEIRQARLARFAQ